MRLLHVSLFALAVRGNRDSLRGVAALAISTVPGAGLIIVASVAFDGATRDLLWLIAVVLDYVIVLAAGVGGWTVHAEHFVERFGLVVIIALGESIVAIGVGAGDLALTADVLLAALLGLTIVCTLWWAYFDVVAVVLAICGGLALYLIAHIAFRCAMCDRSAARAWWPRWHAWRSSRWRPRARP